ncbi:MAG TPA: hypothetical protein VI790_05700 [Candidatus Nanoarchaeia archaeon]|nr:hypothetical protein [Candidatus Nanoarchaeia archaeon]
MRDEEYELVPINPIKKLERKIEELEGQRAGNVPVRELGENVDKLNEQLMKLITVNINLQAKITELLIKTTEQIEQVTEMTELLKRASEIETSNEKEIKIDMSPVVAELKVLSSQNEEIKKGFGELSGFMRKDYRREMISQAINKTGAVQK